MDKEIILNQDEINALAKQLSPFLKSFFASDEGQKEFSEWLERREKCEQ